uniref:Bestrophin family ion channel n=1 Tax=Roseihalotalea indica TaxID=2867963 RepID=A0AA49GH89_9BACT|nr:bestrophin family ion channel [Tunicatimonas sp. TK19036]
MLISRDIQLTRILKLTWKTDLFLILSCGLAYLLDEYVLRELTEFPTMIPALLGTALAFFIGFNNNQAYDRWWEARKIWGGLVNDSRSWARGVLYYCSSPDSEKQPPLSQAQTRMVHRHLAFLYALKANLRKTNDTTYYQYLSEKEILQLARHSNTHNAILEYQSKDLEWLSQQGHIDGFRFMELNEMIVRFCDGMGKSERIKNTVFPTSYHYFTRLFIWVFVILITIVCAQSIGAWAIMLGWLVGFVFHTTHLIGLSLLNPFDPIPSGIPLDQITRTIEINLLEMLGKAEIPEPVKPINHEYVM